MHVDGSSDGTYESLAAMAEGEPRLQVTQDTNRGRAYALAAAFRSARGKFVMFYDDDDDVDTAALAHVLRRLEEQLPPRVCGYVFQMIDDRGRTVGAPLPARSNLLRMRADDGVAGDKKEVILRDLLDRSFYTPRGQDRRVPTSTLWARLALRYDVIGDNTAIGVKHYLSGGYTNRIQRLKKDNPGPMARVHAYRVAGFLLGRYRSPTYFLRSLAALGVHGVQALLQMRPIWRRASASEGAV